MGRSKQREIGALVVEHKERNLAGLVKILAMKKGKRENRTVTFSAVLEVDEDDKYHQALIALPLTGYPKNENELRRDNELFTKKVMGYLTKRGFSLYY